MACFLSGVARRLGRTSLPAFLRSLRAAPRPSWPDGDGGAVRIARIRGALLGRRCFASRNTCFVRAATLYRYLDPGVGSLAFHLGVEEASDPGERMRSHAWVSLDGVPLEPPDALVRGTVREIFRYPEVR
jgi:hypothetical protein